METHAAAKRKANAVVLVEKQHPKRHRVALAELPNLPNLIVPGTQNLPKEKLHGPKNPNAKKPSSTIHVSSSSHIDESLVSDLYEYLHEMEVILIS